MVRRSRGAEPSAPHTAQKPGNAGAVLTPGWRRRVRGEGTATGLTARRGVSAAPSLLSPRCKAHSSPPHTDTSLSAAPTSYNLSSRRLLRADTTIPTPPLPRPVVAQVGGSSAGGGGEAASLRGPADQQPPQPHGGAGHEPQGGGSRRQEKQEFHPPRPKWRRLPLPSHPARGAARGGAFPPTARALPGGKIPVPGPGVGFVLLSFPSRPAARAVETFAVGGILLCHGT